MGHIVNAKEEIYEALAERLSKTPEGAPINEPSREPERKVYEDGQGEGSRITRK